MAAVEGTAMCYWLLLLNFVTLVTIIALMMKLFDLFLTKHDQMVEKLKFCSYPWPYGQSSLPRLVNNSSVNNSSALTASSSSMLTSSPHTGAVVGFDNGQVPVAYWPKLSTFSPVAMDPYGYRATTVVGRDHTGLRSVGSSLDLQRNASTNRRALNGERRPNRFAKRDRASGKKPGFGDTVVRRVKKDSAKSPMNSDHTRKPDLPLVCKGLTKINHMDKLLKQIAKFKEVTMSRINEMTSSREAKKGNNQCRNKYKWGRKSDKLSLATKCRDYSRGLSNVEGTNLISKPNSQPRKPRQTSNARVPQRTLKDIMRDYGFSAEPHAMDKPSDPQNVQPEGRALGFFNRKNTKSSFDGCVSIRNVGVVTSDKAETSHHVRSGGVDQFSQVSKCDFSAQSSALSSPVKIMEFTRHMICEPPTRVQESDACHYSHDFSAQSSALSSPVKIMEFTRHMIREPPTGVQESDACHYSHDQLSNKVRAISGQSGDMSRTSMKFTLDPMVPLSCGVPNHSVTEHPREDDALTPRSASNSSSAAEIGPRPCVGLREKARGRMSPSELLKIIRLYCSSVEASKSYDDALRLFQVEKERLQKLDAIISSTSLRQSEPNSAGEGPSCGATQSEGEGSRPQSAPNLSNNHSSSEKSAVNKSESAPPCVPYIAPLSFPEPGLGCHDDEHADMGYGDHSGISDQSQGQTYSCNVTSPQRRSVSRVGRSYKVRHVCRVGYGVNPRLHGGKGKMKRRRTAASTVLTVGSRSGSRPL